MMISHDIKYDIKDKTSEKDVEDNIMRHEIVINKCMGYLIQDKNSVVCSTCGKVFYEMPRNN